MTGSGAEASRRYVERFLVEDDAMLAARERGEDLGAPPIGAGGGAALCFLAAVIDARTVVEIGTGCGVSGLWLLRGMAASGVLTSIDEAPEHQRHAKQAFAESEVTPGRFRLIGGRALDVLPRLTDRAYDLVFADAAKREYPDYLEQARRLLRPGGIVAFDNALWHDRVADPANRDDDTLAVRELHRAVRGDPTLTPVLLPVGDGLLAAIVH